MFDLDFRNIHVLDKVVRTYVSLERHIKKAVAYEKVSSEFKEFIRNQYQIPNVFNITGEVWRNYKNPNVYDIVFECIEPVTRDKLTISLLHIYICIDDNRGVLWYNKERLKEHLIYVKQ